eukprot:jgi/Botrbrau1/23158/Bobra.0041s0009.1
MTRHARKKRAWMDYAKHSKRSVGRDSLDNINGALWKDDVAEGHKPLQYLQDETGLFE